MAIAPLSASVATPSLGEIVSKRINETKISILQKLIPALIQCTDYTPFAERNIYPKEALLSSLDERTAKFVLKMIGLVQEQLDKFPMINPVFAAIVNNSGDVNVRQKIVEAFTVEPAIALMKEFDEMKDTIVEDILNS